MTDRPSLSEMAAQSGGDVGRGLKCPSCGCAHLPGSGRPYEVTRTNPYGDGNTQRRQLKCRHCGRQFMTVEKVIGVPSVSCEALGQGRRLA